MNESKMIVHQLKDERKPKHIEAILDYLNSHPHGSTFTELSDGVRIPDSTLSRSLRYGTFHGSVVRLNKRYYPSNGDFSMPTFTSAMEVIHDTAKKMEFYNKMKPATEELKVVLAEILGVPGHPSPYHYYNLVGETDMLDLEKILLAAIRGDLGNLGQFTQSLANFIRASLLTATERNQKLNKEIVRILREIDKELFIEEQIFSKIDNGGIDKTSWIQIYDALCILKDNQVSLVLDRLIEEAEKIRANGKQLQKASKSAKELVNDINDTQEHLQNLIKVIQNDLRKPTLVSILYHRQIELFNKQIKYASFPNLSTFFSDLRRFAIGETLKEA